MDIVGAIGVAVICFVAGWFVRSYFPAYFGEKGKNLATKEDISEITQKIESAKLQYSEQLESTKAQLSSQLKTHGVRYEKEYAILDDLTKCLVDVRFAATSLRPAFDQHVRGQSEEDRKAERLKRLFEAQRALFLLQESKRPFFASEIYDALQPIRDAVFDESLDYEYWPEDQRKTLDGYWRKAEENRQKIEQLLNHALELIRKRVTSWENLH